ncbi:DUF3836 domain-containing protein [Myroides odoratus]|uniref:DUF3836 domain-containing protein n=1 Tax=Myroides odoratus TaxID=256 RepID=UPI0033403F52
MSFCRFIGSCFLATLFFNCSVDTPNDSEKDSLIVVDKMVHTYVITQKGLLEENRLQYNITYTFNYDQKGRITFVDENKYVNALPNWYRKFARTTYTYDDSGKVIALTCVDSESGKVLSKWSLEYNKVGLVVRSVEEVKKEVVTYEYNEKHEVVVIKREEMNKVSWLSLEYNVAGNLVRVYHPNQIQVGETFTPLESGYSNENLDFLYSKCPYGIQFVPWIDTKSTANFMNCDGRTWKIGNHYSNDFMLPSSHEVRSEDEHEIMVNLYRLDYKEIQVKE